MGMTYHELSVFGRLRKEAKLGPFGMFERLVKIWKSEYSKSLTKLSEEMPTNIFKHPGRLQSSFTVEDYLRSQQLMICSKIKRFYHYWAINRHKMTIMTPSLHMEDYSPDDNRFDLRPFCYFPFYKSWSFKKIDEAVEKLEQKEKENGKGDVQETK
jgi:NAD+ synthase (glutamine-hydrolysing)